MAKPKTCKNCFLYKKELECLNPWHRSQALGTLGQCIAKKLFDGTSFMLRLLDTCPAKGNCDEVSSCTECWESEVYRKFIQTKKSKVKKEVEISEEKVETDKPKESNPFDII